MGITGEEWQGLGFGNCHVRFLGRSLWVWDAGDLDEDTTLRVLPLAVNQKAIPRSIHSCRIYVIDID